MNREDIKAALQSQSDYDGPCDRCERSGPLWEMDPESSSMLLCRACLRSEFHAAERRRMKRNARRRVENAILREVCGTSARAAREDMGM